MNTYELYWLRESPGGILGGEFGDRVDSLAHLPVNETLAGRIRSLSPPDSVVRLHLPYLSAKARAEWPAEQLRLPVAAAVGSSRVVVGSATEHQYASLLSGKRTAPLYFTHEQEWAAADWETAIVPMMAAHELTGGAGWKPEGRVRLSWTIALADHEPRANWLYLPDRRDGRFLDQFRGVSTSVQFALRQWLPFLYFREPARYSQLQFAHPYLVYAILPAHPSRRKTQLTFHVLEPARVRSSLYRLTKPMAEQLRRAAARMDAAGIAGERREYRPDRALDIVRSMHSLPRAFGSLLSLEAYLVEEFLRFATVADDLRAQSAPRARARIEPGLDLLHDFRCRLSRSYGGMNYPYLADLVLVAATAGLAWRETPRGALTARVTARDLATGREFSAESQFSYAVSAA